MSESTIPERTSSMSSVVVYQASTEPRPPPALKTESRPKPPLQLHHPSRGPNAIHHRKRDHSNISDASLLNVGENTSKTIKPRQRQDLQFPPTTPIQTASSSTLPTDNLLKHRASQFRQRYHWQQRQPPIYFKSEFLKAGLPLPRVTKIESQAFRNFSSIPAGSAKNPDPPRVR